ncbi:MAG: hypothetical protein ACRD12_10795 [Acidimicrobiales bacterium]
MDENVVPCPTCWVLADLLPPAAHSSLSRSRCPAGHENTLAPPVLDYLRSMLGPAFERSA